MIPIFADEWTAPTGIVSFEESLFWFVAGLFVLVLFYFQIFPRKEKRQSIHPQPLIVEEHKEFVTSIRHEADLKVIHDRLDKQHQDELEGRRNLHKDIERVSDKITDKLSEFSLEIANSVGELRGEVRRMK